MGLMKRRLEALESDINKYLRLCVRCGGYVEHYENDAAHWQVEEDFLGPFTTVWVCGSCISETSATKCARCDTKSPEFEKLCAKCLDEYKESISDEQRDSECERCGCDIPPSEWDEYKDTGLCGWCSHMTNKALAEDVEVEDRPQWNPEKDLEKVKEEIISLSEISKGAIEVPTDLRLITFLNSDPKYLYEMDPREFEELVADMLKKFGYRVRLGPRGKDGGVDVFAELDGKIGPELTLVQCKRHRIDRKIQEPTVKQLSTDVDDRNATRGLLVTTSFFSKTAENYINMKRYRLAGADYDQLLRWRDQLRKS